MIGHARTTHAGWRVKVSLSDSIFDVVEFSREKKKIWIMLSCQDMASQAWTLCLSRTEK
jgi:hypothetical protein